MPSSAAQASDVRVRSRVVRRMVVVLVVERRGELGRVFRVNPLELDWDCWVGRWEGEVEEKSDVVFLVECGVSSWGPAFCAAGRFASCDIVFTVNWFY